MVSKSTAKTTPPRGERANTMENICAELQACQGLKKQLAEESTRRFPFGKAEDVDKEKIEKIQDVLKKYAAILRAEKALMDSLLLIPAEG